MSAIHLATLADDNSTVWNAVIITYKHIYMYVYMIQ